MNSWHRGVGTNITPDMTVPEILEAANLNWKVETSPFLYGKEFEVEESKTKIAYHSETKECFGIHGPRRTIFQNKDVVQSFVDFCNTSGDDLTLNRVGSLKGGSQIFAVADMKHEIDVKKVGDIIKTRLVLLESHKSGKGLQILVYTDRLVCTNGMTQVVKNGNKTLGHLKEFDTAAVKSYIKHAYESVYQYEETMEALASIEAEDSVAKMHYIKALGDPSLEWEEQPEAVHTCFKLFKSTGLGSEKLSAYRTLFGVKEAYSQFVNWELNGSLGERAFNSIVSGPRANQNAKFLKQLVSVHL